MSILPGAKHAVSVLSVLFLADLGIGLVLCIPFAQQDFEKHIYLY